MFSISVCMIVKNEEKNLARILECTKKFADEIIVVDTGSTDNTKNVAKIFTKHVYEFEWCDDFAKARNFSFSKATCDYICWLDADDYITAKEIKKINDLKNSTKTADVFMLRYAMGFVDGKPQFKYYRERILKRSKNFVWQGFIHEVISPQGEISYEDIEIQHRKIHTPDPNRNLKIFNQAIKQGKILDARQTYYYARELYYHGKYKKCINVINKYLKMNDKYQPNIIGAYLIKTDCQKLLKNYNNSLNTIFECIKKYLPTPEICCKIGEIYTILNKKNQGIYWYETAINCPRQTSGFIDERYEKFIPSLELVRLYFSEGDIKNSYKYHNLTKTCQPNHPSVIYNENFFNNYFKLK